MARRPPWGSEPKERTCWTARLIWFRTSAASKLSRPTTRRWCSTHRPNCVATGLRGRGGCDPAGAAGCRSGKGSGGAAGHAGRQFQNHARKKDLYRARGGRECAGLSRGRPSRRPPGRPHRHGGLGRDGRLQTRIPVNVAGQGHAPRRGGACRQCLAVPRGLHQLARTCGPLHRRAGDAVPGGTHALPDQRGRVSRADRQDFRARGTIPRTGQTAGRVGGPPRHHQEPGGGAAGHRNQGRLGVGRSDRARAGRAGRGRESGGGARCDNGAGAR